MRKPKPSAPDKVASGGKGVGHPAGVWSLSERASLERWAAKYYRIEDTATRQMMEQETLGDSPARRSDGVVLRVGPRVGARRSPKLPSTPSTIELLRSGEMGAFVRELTEAHFGIADWRGALCLVATVRTAVAERAELSAWLLHAIDANDGAELRAFARCLDVLKDGASVVPARVRALMFVWRHWRQTGRVPTQATVRNFLIKSGFTALGDIGSSMRKNEARQIFFGPVLGTLPHARGGRKKTTLKKSRKVK